MQNASQASIFSVSKLNHLARTILESEIGSVWVEAEISNFVRASSGHWYFTLKDKKAQIKSAMFKGANRFVKQAPREGDQVLVRGNISLYEPRGDYQLIIEHLEMAGEGQLKRRFEQLKQQLQQEGLFDFSRKRELPESMSTVGVITSPTGAALHDILTVLKRRSPMTDVIIYPSQVQGDAATAQLVRTLQLANQRQEVEVIILGRGGGSLEDLWCFNEESLARAIVESKIPVISAVGHETDISIADLVADLRAPTPSAAAELVSQDKQAQLNKLAELYKQLHQAGIRSIRDCQQSLNLITQRLKQVHPERQLQQQAQQVDHLLQRVHTHIKHAIHERQRQCDRTEYRLQQCSPASLVQSYQNQLDGLTKRLTGKMEQQLSQAKSRLGESAHLLNGLSPLNTIARGFSVSFQEGELVKSIEQITIGKTLISQVQDGEIESQVVAVNKLK